MSTKNYKTGVMLGLVWGGVGGCRGLFWTGILGGRRGGGVRIGVWAPRIIKLGLCRGGVGFGLGYWGVGTKNYKTGVVLGRRWGLWRIILDWDTWGTQGRRCFKIEV